MVSNVLFEDTINLGLWEAKGGHLRVRVELWIDE